jgi:hypothetical protein
MRADSLGEGEVRLVWQEPAGLTATGRHAAVAAIVSLIVFFVLAGSLFDAGSILIPLALILPLGLMVASLRGGGGEFLYNNVPTKIELVRGNNSIRVSRSGGWFSQDAMLTATRADKLVLRYLLLNDGTRRPLRVEMHQSGRPAVISLAERVVDDPSEPGTAITLSALIGSWWPDPGKRYIQSAGHLRGDSPFEPWIEPDPVDTAERMAHEPLMSFMGRKPMLASIAVTIVAILMFTLPQTRPLAVVLTGAGVAAVLWAHGHMRIRRR